MSNSCLTPASSVKTYPSAPTADNGVCEFLAEWQPCNDCGGGYDTGDGVSVCINGTKYIAKSLVDDNRDEPLAGSTNVPPTWELNTLTGWLFK